MQVFLSYARSDEAFAKELSSELAKRGFSVWVDKQELLPGDNWHKRIADALARSNAMVVLISPESMSSPEIRGEIQYALGNPNYEGRLFPVEVRPTREVPWILDRFQRLRAAEGARKVSQSIARALEAVA